jgi:uncharacterized protein (TIGR02246 family)
MTTTDAAAPAAGATAVSDVEKAAACSVTSRIDDAWNRNDADGFAAVFTEDGSLALSGDRYFKSRESIRVHVGESFAGPHKGTRLIQNIVDFMFTGPEAGVITTEGGVLVPGETEVHPERELRATWVVTKQSGQWFIAAYQNGRRADGRLRGDE